MKTTLLAILLSLCTSAMAQKYYYPGGFFEKEGDLWSEYTTDENGVNTLIDSYTELGPDDNYILIGNDQRKVRVPVTTECSFLQQEAGKTTWKYKAKCIAEPIKRKPRLSADLKAKMSKNFNPRTPYDGIHLYTSPFGFLNTPDISLSDARAILNFSDCFTVVEDEAGENVLKAVRNGMVGYETFVPVEDTTITTEFNGDRIKRCTYTFTFDSKASADKAVTHLKNHMKIASKAREGKRYKVCWCEETTLFSIDSEEHDGKGRFIVDVEYKDR